MRLFDGKPKPAAIGTVVRPGGMVLMLRRQREPYAGMWALPGGRIEAGEHPDSAMVREFREETGLVTAVERFCGLVSEICIGDGIRDHFLLYIFRLTVLGGQETGGAEGPLRWVCGSDLPGNTAPSNAWIVQRMLLPGAPPRLTTAIVSGGQVRIEQSYG